MNKKIDLVLPISGEVVGLTEVNDYLFNKKIMGEGANLLNQTITLYILQ